MSAAGKPPALLPVRDALARILDAAAARPSQSEDCPLWQADGRVLASDLPARRTQPPFDMSSMDGYALRAADLIMGARLRVIGESAAGHPFPGRVSEREAVRIFTGAAIPQGADAVLMQELAEREGEVLRSEATLAPGTFIRRTGRDFTTGEAGLLKGLRLEPRHLAFAAAMNHTSLPVARRPRVALLATGDELCRPGADAPAEATIASNIYGIAAQARRAGAEVFDLGIARDTRESLHAALDAAISSGSDVLVTVGGASVGQHDLVRPVLTERGAQLDFYRIAMRPGKPLNFGRFGGLLYLGLPGNPVSAMVCATLFLLPLIEALQGCPDAGADRSEAAILGADLPANDLREDFLRAKLSRDGAGNLVATAFPDQDSSLLSVLAAADALLIRPAHEPAMPAGSPCRILRMDHRL